MTVDNEKMLEEFLPSPGISARTLVAPADAEPKKDKGHGRRLEAGRVGS